MSRKRELDQKVISLQTRFLRALRNVQPLAFLASALFVVAALSRNEFVGASDWAIASAFAFLLAFLFALSAELIPVPNIIYACWTATWLGILFILLVAYEFSKFVQPVGRLPIAIISFSVILAIGFYLQAFVGRIRHMSGRVAGGKKSVLLTLYFLAVAGIVVALTGQVASVIADLFNVKALTVKAFTVLNVNVLVIMDSASWAGIGLFISATVVLILLEKHWLSSVELRSLEEQKDRD